jgi:hypothetical protein
LREEYRLRIFENKVLRRIWVELDSAGSGCGLVAGFCEHGDEPSVYVRKAGYFLIS